MVDACVAVCAVAVVATVAVMPDRKGTFQTAQAGAVLMTNAVTACGVAAGAHAKTAGTHFAVGAAARIVVVYTSGA